MATAFTVIPLICRHEQQLWCGRFARPIRTPYMWDIQGPMEFWGPAAVRHFALFALGYKALLRRKGIADLGARMTGPKEKCPPNETVSVSAQCRFCVPMNSMNVPERVLCHRMVARTIVLAGWTS